MYFDAIEIGTAHFETEIQEDSPFLRTKQQEGLVTYRGRILSVEPVKCYLDELPARENCYKEHAAVSNYDGEVSVWYITPENLVKYGLSADGADWWMMGCNSINSPHPTMLKLFNKHRNVPEHKMYKALLTDVFSVDEVKCYNPESLFRKYDVEGVSYLKIDTEGHDAVILLDYFDYCEEHPHLKAKWIVHENNKLLSEEDKEAIKVRASQLGYDWQGLDGNPLCYDRLLTLRL